MKNEKSKLFFIRDLLWKISYQGFGSDTDTDMRDVDFLQYRHWKFAKERWRRDAVRERTVLKIARKLIYEIGEGVWELYESIA